MANPIIKIKRGTTVPTTGQLQAGEFAIDQVAKNLYLGIEVGGIVTNEIVGGNGTFATHADVATAVTNATGSLGTMSTQNANNVAITGGSISGVNLNVTAPIIDLAGGALVNVPGPTNASDPANKWYVDTVVSNLGSVFHYVGDVSSATTPLDLTTLSDQATGAYYKVDVAGAYTDGATTFNAKVGDAFVKTTTGWQKLDNVDAVVSGTANEIAVTGDENVGYTVSIDPVFSGRMTTAEGDIDALEGRVTTAEGDITALEGRATDLETKTQNIDLALTTPGDTKFNGYLRAGYLNLSDGMEVFNAALFNPVINAFSGVRLLGGDIEGTGSSQLLGFVVDGGSY